MRSRLLLTLLAGLITATAEGADPEGPRVQLRFVSLGQTITGVGIAGADGKASPIVIPADSLGRPESHSSRRLRLVSLPQATIPAKKPDEPSKPEDTPPSAPGFRKKRAEGTPAQVKAGSREIAAIDLPSLEHQRFIIIVHPGKGNGLTAIPDRLGFFPPGSERYLNFSPDPVVIELPSGRHKLPANASIVLRPGAANLRPYQVKISAVRQGEEKIVFSAYTSHDEARRNLRILLSEGDGIGLKSVSDGLAAEDNYR